jgi:hypothetical protein
MISTFEEIYMRIVNCLGIFFCVAAGTANAQWSTDSTVNNTVNAQAGQQNIGNSNYYQNNLTSDSAGGVIVAWQDTRNNTAIYTQRLNQNGNCAWDSLGVPAMALSTNTGNVLNPSVASDGKGGAIVVWQKNSNGVGDSLYAQRIDVAGNRKWAAGGVPICTNGNTNDFPVICSDGFGGAIIAWANHIAYNESLFAQRIDSNGAVLWTTNGISVRGGGTYSPPYPQICGDGFGGAYLAWRDVATPTQEYVQRISGAGVLQWASPGVALTISSPAVLEFPRIISDGNHGAIVEWDQSADYSYTYKIHVQRIDSIGNALWTSGGVQVSSLKSNNANITTDGNNGVIIAWIDYRIGGGLSNVYVQRITSDGTLAWDTNGIAITSTGKLPYSGGSSAYFPSIATDGNGGAFIGWIDTRSGTFNNYLYAEQISNSGLLHWPINGMTISKSSNFGCYNQQIVSAGQNAAILVWEDTRNSGATNLYASRVSLSGLTSVSNNSVLQPLRTTLKQNYPNPFNPSTIIQFSLERRGHATLQIFNLLGQEIATLFDGEVSGGNTVQVTFNASKLSSGIYFARLESVDGMQIKKIILQK